LSYDMKQKLNIELEDEIFQKLHTLCKGDNETIQEYIIQAIKHHVSQDGPSDSSKDKENLEDYLNKGQSGSRNYGVKGQGW
jgi:predicted transcriptional regulator